MTSDILELAIKEYCKTNKSARQVAREYSLGKDKVTNNLKRRGLLRPKKDNSFNINYFETIDTSVKAYWLGFIFADGCVHTKANCLEIGLAYKDINHLYKFKRDIKFKGDVKEKIVTLKHKKYRECRLRLFSPKLKQDLINLGCIPNKTFKLKYPTIPHKYHKDFIRGYFDGDGSVYTYKRKDLIKPYISLSLIGTKSFISEVQQIFIEEVGVREVSLYVNKTKTVWEYKKAFNEALKILQYLYKDSSIYLDRKYGIFKEVAQGSKIGGAFPRKRLVVPR